LFHTFTRGDIIGLNLKGDVALSKLREEEKIGQYDEYVNYKNEGKKALQYLFKMRKEEEKLRQ